MRRVPADVISRNNFTHPFTCLITGSTGVGKTTFVKNLIMSNRISNLDKFSCVYYFYPNELDLPPVKWDRLFETLEVSYHNETPDAAFFNAAKPNSLVVFDDDYYKLSNCDEFAKAFRVYARKFHISIIAISQTYYEGQKHGRTIRNNCSIHVLFNNYGDQKINLRAARALGFEKQYREAAVEAYENNHGYIIIFTGPKVKNKKLRVQTNFFHQSKNYCFY